MDEPPNERTWPGDLGSDHSAAGTLTRWSAFMDGVRTNARGRRRGARMLVALVLAVGAATALVYLLTLGSG